MESEYISIAELAARSGTAVPCTSNLPVRLDSPDSVWFIDQGVVNLFLIESRDGVEQTAPQHLLRRESGWLVPGVALSRGNGEKENTLSIIAKGRTGTLLKRLPVSLLSQVHPDELAQQVDTWVNAVTDMLSRFTNPIPRPTALVDPNLTRTLAPCTLSSRHGVVWVSSPVDGAALFMDMVDPSGFAGAGSSRETLLPLTRTSWLTLHQESTMTGKSTESLALQGLLLSALASFHAAAFTLERLNRRLAVVDEANLEHARTSSRDTAEKVARQRLYNIYDLPMDREDRVEDTALADALQIIGRHEGIDFTIPGRSGLSDSPIHLGDLLEASGVRARRIRLRPEDNWWRSDSNAMLAFRAEDGQPVVLLPGIFRHYREIDPVSKRSVRVTKDRAGTLGEEAWMFYRPFPGREVGPADLLDIAGRGSAADLVRLVIAGLPTGLIRLLPAVALGLVAHEILGGGSAETIYGIAFVVAAFGVLGALLHLQQSTVMMRLEGRSTSRVEAAFWDRLMRLPPSILHRHLAGDLATAGMSFQNLRDNLQGVVANSILSILFLLPVFGVIFFYDVALGVVALVFSLVSLFVTVALGLSQIPAFGRMTRAARRVTGQLFQVVGGISKLRVDNAEGSAYAIWAREYREQKRAEIELGTLEEHSRAFGAALPFLAGGAMLLAVVLVGDRNFPVGDFLVVFTVFLVFQSATTRFGESFAAIAAMLTTFKQMSPLLAVTPENDTEGELVEYLGGDIRFDRISFRYDPDGPLILDDVTIHARPGEFIAIAGESGAGKSTLFRLALGIDWPTTGAVYYDGRDLRHLNLKQVRRRIGVVPQSVGLHPQDIWDNLAGHRDVVTTEEVWKSARTAEIDSQIKEMPMGMMTMVGTTQSVLSGGESQRITIARSVLGNPRVMLFDEATNWLDNENQARVMQNLADLTSTRIVIAHRLSTLEKADRIFVLQKGKVVQNGSFEELMEVDGIFRELVKRQVA